MPAVRQQVRARSGNRAAGREILRPRSTYLAHTLFEGVAFLDAGGRGRTEVDQEVAMLLRDLRLADAQPAAAGPIDQTIEAFDGAMEVYARALSDGAEKFLVGPPSEMVYRAYNKKPEGAAPAA